MRKTALFGLAALVAAATASGALPTVRGQAQTSAAIQPVSWDGWLLAKAKAEENDAAGNYVAALQYYLEYVRQAQGLNSPVRVAWGKNNAAYMIIKMHQKDSTVDLAPAKRLLEEGLAIPEATEECRTRMAKNLEYVKAMIGRAVQ